MERFRRKCCKEAPKQGVPSGHSFVPLCVRAHTHTQGAWWVDEWSHMVIFPFFPTQTHPHPFPYSRSSLRFFFFFSSSSYVLLLLVFTLSGLSAPPGYCSSIKFSFGPTCIRTGCNVRLLLLIAHIFGAPVGGLRHPIFRLSVEQLSFLHSGILLNLRG